MHVRRWRSRFKRIGRPTLVAALVTGCIAGVSAVTQFVAQAGGSTPPTYVWPEAHQDAGLTGISLDPSISASNAASLGVSWMAYTGSEILSSPVVAWNSTLSETLVYVANDAGYVIAYNQGTGLPVWSVQLGSPIRSVPLVEGQYLWVAPTTAVRAYKLDAATGATVCSAPLQKGESVDASPVFATPPGGKSTVYFADNDNGTVSGPVTAVDEATCTVDFTSAPEPKAGTGGEWDFLSYAVSAAGEGLVLFGTSDPDSSVYAIDAKTGTQVWRFKTDNPSPYSFDVGAGVTVSPPGSNGFADGVAYVANKYGIMYALDLTTGTLIWQFNFGAQTGLQPPGALDTAALSGTDLVFGDNGGVWDLNAVTGQKKWYHTNAANGEVDGAPAIVGPTGNQVVVESDLTGEISVLSLADGSTLFGFQTGAYSVGSPAETDGNIIDISGNGFLYDFAAGAGEAPNPATAVSSPANQSTVANPNGSLNVTGTATNAAPVSAVNVYIQRDGSAGEWWDGSSATWVAAPYPNAATVASPGATSTAWSTAFPIPPAGGNFEVFASAVSGGPADPSIGLSSPTVGRSSFTVSPSTTATRFNAPVPWVGPAGPIQVQGSGFSAGETVDISFAGALLKSVVASSSGAVAPVNVVMPATAPFGPATLDAVGQTSGNEGVAPIYVTNNWAEFGFNSEHSAFDPNDTVLAKHLSVSPQTFLSPGWSFNAGAPVAGAVAVTDGIAFFADQAGDLYAIKMVTGVPLWSYNLPNGPQVDTTPAVTQTSLVLVAASDGTLTAVHEFSGALAWTVNIGGNLQGSPVVAGGTAYVASEDGTLTAVNVSNGTTRWAINLGSQIVATPAVDATAGTVAVATYGGSISALSVATGGLKWKHTVPGNVSAGLVIGQGNVYVGSLNDTLYALHESTGAQNWAYLTGGAISAAVTDTGSQVVVGSQDGLLRYLSPSTGKAIYKVTVGQPVVGVASASDFVASVGSGGDVLGSKPADTNPRAWVTTQGSQLSAPPTVVNGEVVVPGMDGLVCVFTVPGMEAF